MAGLNWTDQAIADLTNIAEFIRKDSAKYAKITVQRIRTSARQISQFPLSGRIVPETEIKILREIIIGNYRLIYKIVSNERIDIITVFHSSKQLDTEELKKHAR